MRRALLLASVAAAALAVATASPVFSAAGGGKVIYDSTVDPLPGNLPSVGPEAYSFTELGDEVTLAGKPRTVKRVTVTLSSWGCQSGHWYTADCSTSPGATFTLPITFNIYNPGANNRAGSLIATTTQTFDVPYRPSSDNVNCSGGRWLDGAQGCFNGLAVNVTFDFNSQQVKLPDTVVYGIAYNTSHYGPQPIGDGASCFASSGGCPYDSLNIALAPSVTVGSKPFPNTLYQNAVFAGDYCDNGLDGVGAMRLDSVTSACWTGFIPAVQISASNAGGDGGDAAQGP
jgi:hypothetical protein